MTSLAELTAEMKERLKNPNGACLKVVFRTDPGKPPLMYFMRAEHALPDFSVMDSTRALLPPHLQRQLDHDNRKAIYDTAILQIRDDVLRVVFPTGRSEQTYKRSSFTVRCGLVQSHIEDVLKCTLYDPDRRKELTSSLKKDLASLSR